MNGRDLDKGEINGAREIALVNGRDLIWRSDQRHDLNQQGARFWTAVIEIQTRSTAEISRARERGRRRRSDALLKKRRVRRFPMTWFLALGSSEGEGSGSDVLVMSWGRKSEANCRERFGDVERWSR